ncbi:MAG: hypothetical protein IJF03_09085 [Lachnospiraceae bacterium]|nr:hypothetical protein [Lachnospiraceae bacterium]
MCEMIRERLNFLIGKGLLSIGVLEAATGFERGMLEEFLNGEKEAELNKCDLENGRRRLRLLSMTDLLIEGMEISEDDRVRGNVELLVQEYGMNYQMIAGYTNMEEQEILGFMSGKKELPCEKKYKLAVKVFSLMYVVKNIIE